MQCVKGCAVSAGPLRELFGSFFTVFLPSDWLQNVRGASSVVDPAPIAERNAIAIDEVMTTGATMSECARVLKRAQVEQVGSPCGSHSKQCDAALGCRLRGRGEERSGIMRRFGLRYVHAGS